MHSNKAKDREEENKHEGRFSTLHLDSSSLSSKWRQSADSQVHLGTNSKLCTSEKQHGLRIINTTRKHSMLPPEFSFCGHFISGKNSSHDLRWGECVWLKECSVLPLNSPVLVLKSPNVLCFSLVWYKSYLTLAWALRLCQDKVGPK